MELDHIAVAGTSLGAATEHAAQALGVQLQPGGQHDVFYTHNTLLGLANGLYLEAIAINPDALVPDRPRWFDLDRFHGVPRLTNWICRCDDLDATLAALPDGFGDPVSLRRGDLRWRMAVPASGILPYDNCAPALIEWEGTAHPAALLAQSECRLTQVHVSHPDAVALSEMLKPHLSDERIRYSTGPAGLTAHFDTPSGPRVLT
ncbi:VOC family protein [Sulfitobacter sp. MF3-043]|uniref:VOC family protein n=1 Tax=Sulfitobacter sediminivivens TaxID=3252902 RepID=UPI0036D9733A